MKKKKKRKNTLPAHVSRATRKVFFDESTMVKMFEVSMGLVK